MTTLGALRAHARDQAASRGISPREIDLLLSDQLRRPVTWLLAHGDHIVSTEDLALFESRLQRRLSREPIQYILGHAEFFGREFSVDPRVLIPRPETEFVVEQAIDRAPRRARVLDLGTGSGCIAISIALERTDTQVFALDRSPAALAVARHNAAALGGSVAFFGSDLLAAVRGSFDLIVSNPPYIVDRDIPALQPEVAEHEPFSALSGGESGFDTIEAILEHALPRLAAPGLLIMEIGFGQRRGLTERAEARGWRVEDLIDDLAGIPRVAVLGKN